MLSERLKPKRISIEKQPETPSKSKRPRQGRKAPRELLENDDTNFCPEDEALEAASIAMKTWNRLSISNKGREYEFVEVIGSKRLADPYIVHCNFIARPKTESGVEPRVFFGEVRYSASFRKDGKTGAIGCTTCCILGPIGTKTGLVRCCICKMHPDLIQHPDDGDFFKRKGRCFTKGQSQKKKTSCSETPTGPHNLNNGRKSGGSS